MVGSNATTGVKRKKTTDMKKHVCATMASLALGSLMVLSPASRAQDNPPSTNQPPGAAAPGGRRGNPLDAMKQQLNLTDDQVEKLKPILKEQQEKMKALRADTTLSREDMMAKRKELQAGLSAKVKDILTPDQFTKWQTMVQNRGRRGQKGAPGAGQPGQGGATPPPAAANPGN
jgi:protein CpxP